MLECLLVIDLGRDIKCKSERVCGYDHLCFGVDFMAVHELVADDVWLG